MRLKKFSRLRKRTSKKIKLFNFKMLVLSEIAKKIENLSKRFEKSEKRTRWQQRNKVCN